MDKKPAMTKIADDGVIWSNTFEKFSATVYVPKTDLMADTLNYGFIAPYLLVFAEKKYSYEEAVAFAKEQGFEKIAAKYASSVVFIYPNSKDGWKDAAPDIFAEILSNSKIHQYYENGVVKAWNRFTKQLDAYFIRGAIFRTCLYGFGESADYIAQNCLNHFEGDGLWGRADSAPVCCILTNLSKTPEIDAADIPVVSYGNSDEINKLFEEKCTYFLKGDKPAFEKDLDFVKQFRRMLGELEVDPDLEKDGLVIEPSVISVKTSADNQGDDKGTENHKLGYFAFYNKGIFDKGPVPLVLCFHGGGDSCFYIANISGWAGIAHKHNFLLVAIENHLNSTASEMVELVEHLKKQYKIDETRIYSTGFSMGGCKTWDIIQEQPNLIAAAAPMDATFEVGFNIYGQPIPCELNKSVSVPTYYIGGELTPLPELPFQAQKCLDRMKYILELNRANAEYSVILEDKDNWKNKFWGIDGDFREVFVDPKRKGKLTLEFFKNADGKCYNVFGSIDNQGHECREHTCELAWRFLRQFSRKDNIITGGEVEELVNSLKTE